MGERIGRLTLKRVAQWFKQPLPQRRKAAYRHVVAYLEQGALTASPNLLELLSERARLEEDADIRHYVSRAIKAVNRRLAQKTAFLEGQLQRLARKLRAMYRFKKRELRRGSLARAVWGHCRKPTLVVYPAGRDEKAMLLLTEFLARSGYLNVYPKGEPLQGFQPDADDTTERKTFVVISRFAQLAANDKVYRDWSPKDVRYALPGYSTPRGDRRNWPVRSYHVIFRRVAPGEPDIEYPTEYNETTREVVDYGVVRAYPKLIGNDWLYVIECAGASMWGTLGAVFCATKKLAQVQDNKRCIPAPKVRKGNRPPVIEIFVKVVATLGADRREASSFTLSILDLRAGRQAFSFRKFRWETPKAADVTFYHPPGQRPTTTNVSDCWIDGLRAPLKFRAGKKCNNEVGRLLAALALHKRAGRPTVTVADLAADVSIWGGKAATPAHAIQQLTTLRRRYLGDALEIDETAAATCTLTANVRFIARLAPPL